MPIMPLYSLVLLFVFLQGFFAILQVPGLKGADVDAFVIPSCFTNF